MKPLVVPKKYQKIGLKVFCSKCNRQVSKSCGETKKGINSCQNADKHNFKAVVHIPMSDYKRRTRLLHSKDVEGAIKEMGTIKKNLKKQIINQVTSLISLEKKIYWLNYVKTTLISLKG